MSGERSRERLYVFGGVRTPFVRSFGQLRGVPVDDLARGVFTETLARTGVDPAALDEVILGCAGPPVQAMNVSRVAALRSGVPKEVPAYTVHRNCASGIEATASALMRVRAGDADLVLVGGAESMSEAPMQIRRRGVRRLIEVMRRKGFGPKLGAATRLRPADLLPRNTLRPALTDPISGLLMGDTAEVLARENGITREQQDEYAAESQRRSVAARASGVFSEESIPFLVPPSFGRIIQVDDGIRPDATAEKLARLKPVFDRRFGSVTVGNSCQITDGAASFVAASEQGAAALGGDPIGVVQDCVTVGCDPRRMGLGPVPAIRRLLERNELKTSDIDLFEINEAFAVQVLACLHQMGEDAPDREQLNVNGGAIALGHPVGATGVRIILTLLLELRRRGLKRGVASLCVGGGQGAAVLVENPGAA